MDQNSLSFEESAEIKQAAEINNALAVILGNAQLLLLKNTVAPEDRGKLKAIEKSSFRIQGLVERLLRGHRTPSIQTASDELPERHISFP
jgi:nitrogen-specific signal transduction histidine kinase